MTSSELVTWHAAGVIDDSDQQIIDLISGNSTNFIDPMGVVLMHEQCQLRSKDGRWLAPIDLGVYDAVKCLWDKGVPTLYSCEGNPDPYILLHPIIVNPESAIDALPEGWYFSHWWYNRISLRYSRPNEG